MNRRTFFKMAAVAPALLGSIPVVTLPQLPDTPKLYNQKTAVTAGDIWTMTSNTTIGNKKLNKGQMILFMKTTSDPTEHDFVLIKLA